MHASAQFDELPALRMRYEPLVLIVLALASGIFLDRTFPQPLESWWYAAGGALGLWCLLWLLRCKPLASCLVLLSILSLGGAWHHWRWFLVPEEHLVVHSREDDQPDRKSVV